MLDQIEKPEVPIRFRTWWTNVTKLQCIHTYEHETVGECAALLTKSIGIKTLDIISNPSTNVDADAMTDFRREIIDEEQTAPHVESNMTDSCETQYPEWSAAVKKLSNDDLVQRAISVSEWRDEYRELCKKEYLRRTGIVLEDPSKAQLERSNCETETDTMPLQTDWESSVARLTNE